MTELLFIMGLGNALFALALAIVALSATPVLDGMALTDSGIFIARQ